MNAEERQQRIDGVRGIMDFYEANPEVRLPFYLANEMEWTIYMHSPEAFAAFAESAPDPKIVLDEIENIVFAKQSFGPMTLQARVDIKEIDVPEEWTAPEMVAARKVSQYKIARAVIKPKLDQLDPWA